MKDSLDRAEHFLEMVSDGEKIEKTKDFSKCMLREFFDLIFF